MFRFLLLLIIAAGFMNQAVGSPCDLAVTVVDVETGSVIPKATVLVSEYRRGDKVLGRESTASDGRAYFAKHLEPGQYSVWVSYPGFESGSSEVSCNSEPVQVSISIREHSIVSLVELIARPEHWDGRKVRVRGFLNLQFEGNALYLHEVDWKEKLFSNAIWVHATPSMREHHKLLNRRYVMIEATFDGEDKGHMGMFQGALRDISSCTSLR